MSRFYRLQALLIAILSLTQWINAVVIEEVSAEAKYDAQQVSSMKQRLDELKTLLAQRKNASDSYWSEQKVAMMEELTGFKAETLGMVCSTAEELYALVKMHDDINAVMADLDEKRSLESELSTLQISTKGKEGWFEHFLELMEKEKDNGFLFDSFGTDEDQQSSIDSILTRSRIYGWTKNLYDELTAYADETSDGRAYMILSFVDIFKPDMKQSNSTTSDVGRFSSALQNLETAANDDQEVASTMHLLFDVVSIQYDSNSPAHGSKRREKARKKLLRMASKSAETDPLLYSFAGYQKYKQMKSGTLKCSNVIDYYEKLAEFKVAEIMDDAPLQFHVRLSDLWETNPHIDGNEGSNKSASYFKQYFAEEKKNTTNSSDTLNAVADKPLNSEALSSFEFFRSVSKNPNHELYSEAAQYLGVSYLFGDEGAGITQDSAIAANYFQQAADAGNTNAQFAYGTLLLHGIGLGRDNKTAMEYLQRAAEKGHARASYGLGLMYMEGTYDANVNTTKAIYYLEKALKRGHVQAHLPLGKIYYEGSEDTDYDDNLAFYHLNAAEEYQGESSSAELLYTLGVMHQKGMGTQADCETALSYYRRSTLMHEWTIENVPFTFDNALRSYEERDYAKAFINYRLLSEFGSESALMNAAFLLEKFGDKIIDSGLIQAGNINAVNTHALNLYEEAADLDDLEALRILAECYETSSTFIQKDVCIPNKAKAAEYLKKASALGDHEATFRLAWMYTWGSEASILMAKEYAQQCVSATQYPHNAPCIVLEWIIDFKYVISSAGEMLRSLVDYVL